MQLRGDDASETALWKAINEYYSRFTKRAFAVFSGDSPISSNVISVNVLVDRIHVIRYIVSNDATPNCGRWTSGLQLARGPFFFGAADFWSYENYLRFDNSATTEAVVHNLKLMDEFFTIDGYRLV